MLTRKNIEVIGGGTVYHVRNHLALTAPAYGHTARVILDLILGNHYDSMVYHNVNLHLTKMANAGQGDLETNADIERLVDKLVANPDTKIIFFNPALVDFEGSIYEYNNLDGDVPTTSGKYEPRLKTSKGEREMLMWPAPKIVSKIRKERKDIFLVAFKTTCGATEDEQFLTGLHLLKSSSCNLVLANDTKTRMNMVITPEQARYHVTSDRREALAGLVDMAMLRSKGTFTRTIVPPNATPHPWNEPVAKAIPESLKKVVDYCIAKGAYKPFNGATVGHFAVKMPMNDWIMTSRRKTDFNKLDEVGLTLCQPREGNLMFSSGGKPSVGGQSQRIVFKDHPDMDCIVHFHCPPKPNAKLSVRSQREFECGSHECGKNTSQGLRLEEPGLKCVYLDNHGPNIVFKKDIDPQKVINFIESNFDLSQSTDGIDRSKTLVE